MCWQDSAWIGKGPIWVGLLVPVLLNLFLLQTCTDSEGGYTCSKRMKLELKKWNESHLAVRESRDFHATATEWNSILQSLKWEKNVNQRQSPKTEGRNLSSRVDNIRNRVSESKCWDTGYSCFSHHGFCHSGGSFLEWSLHCNSDLSNLSHLSTSQLQNLCSAQGICFFLSHNLSWYMGFVCFQLMSLEI